MADKGGFRQREGECWFFALPRDLSPPPDSSPNPTLVFLLRIHGSDWFPPLTLAVGDASSSLSLTLTQMEASNPPHLHLQGTTQSSSGKRMFRSKALFNSINQRQMLQSRNGGKGFCFIALLFVLFSLIPIVLLFSSAVWLYLLVGMFWLCLSSLQLGDSAMDSLCLAPTLFTQLTLSLLVTFFPHSKLLVEME